MTNSPHVSRRLLAFVLVGGLCLTGIVAFAWRINSTTADASFQALPSDEQLIDNFDQNRSQFNRLAELLLAEQQSLTIFPQDSKCRFNDPRSIVNDLGDENCTEYAKLFKLLGLEWAFSGGRVFWAKVAAGPVTWGDAYKFYYYLPVTPSETIVDNTDTYAGEKPSVCRLLDGNWYICLVRVDIK